MLKFLNISILILVTFYLFILLFMFLFQRSFMYHPDVKNSDDVQINFNYKEVFIESEKNILLKSWFSFSDTNKKTILFFHGNAGTLDA